MIVQNWATVLQQSFNDMLLAVVNFIPNFLFAIVVFVIGWVIAWFVGNLVMQAVRAIKVDHALKTAGVDDVVSRAGYHLDSGAFLGLNAVGWTRTRCSNGRLAACAFAFTRWRIGPHCTKMIG